MFFKKKVDVENYCAGNLHALFEPERETTYELLRQRCADSALKAADQTLYFDHIRAIIIQLLQIAIVKNCKFDISSDAGMFIMSYLREHRLSRIHELSSVYNRAFGRHAKDGVAGIVEVFSEQVTDSRLSEAAMQRFYTEFYAILRAFFADLESIKLTSKRS
jgi:hypothetical protein